MPTTTHSPPIFLIIFLITSSCPPHSTASFLAQPLKPNTVPAIPVTTRSPPCRLDLSAELFGGVAAACGKNNLDRSRCCPVLAAWLYAAHARTALHAAAPPEESVSEDLPIMPDDSQKCVSSLAAALERREVRIPQPNATCDPILCFCGIRLHQIGSLSCSAAFGVSSGGVHRNATPTAAVRNLEGSCRNSSYSGCTRCLAALQKVKGGSGKNKTTGGGGGGDRASEMFDRDCQLMGLTWLLAKNKTEYIPTVSAVLRAIMYSSHPPPREGGTCSPDQENMPLAVDSLQFDKAQSSSTTTPARSRILRFSILTLSLLLVVRL